LLLLLQVRGDVYDTGLLLLLLQVCDKLRKDSAYQKH
jgi:hypothetical protein